LANSDAKLVRSLRSDKLRDGKQAEHATLKPVVNASKLTSLIAPQSHLQRARFAVLASANPISFQAPNRCGTGSSVTAIRRR
jgi:hypothetical protein